MTFNHHAFSGLPPGFREADGEPAPKGGRSGILDHYGFSKLPFGPCKTDESTYFTPVQKDALDRLTFAAGNRKLAVLFGLPGTGKTTVLRRLRDRVRASKNLFLYVADSRLTPSGLYNCLLVQLGQTRSFYRGEGMRKLHRELDERRSVDRLEIVVAVDEAHLLDKEAIEEIRFLLNSDMDSQNPLSLVLCGQYELWDRLALRSSAAIKQRVDVICRLVPFTMNEVKAYIGSRLEMVGIGRPLFTDEAVNRIFAFTSGIARLVDKLCTSCLLHGFLEESQMITEEMVNHMRDRETI
jgi:type II secretory pathway predicted ATPase ExeA